MVTPTRDSRFQRAYADDANLKRRVFALLEVCFPGITQAEQHHSLPLGAPWEQVSTPFVYELGDVAITHIGVLSMPLVVQGRTVLAGGIHAVGTHPGYRRRGYYREVMAEVLQYCASRYDTLLLTTGQPELYAPFGFRVIPEHHRLEAPFQAIRHTLMDQPEALGGEGADVFMVRGPFPAEGQPLMLPLTARC